jgi:hypothetical protein
MKGDTRMEGKVSVSVMAHVSEDTGIKIEKNGSGAKEYYTMNIGEVGEYVTIFLDRKGLDRLGTALRVALAEG